MEDREKSETRRSMGKRKGGGVTGRSKVQDQKVEIKKGEDIEEEKEEQVRRWRSSDRD